MTSPCRRSATLICIAAIILLCSTSAIIWSLLSYDIKSAVSTYEYDSRDTVVFLHVSDIHITAAKPRREASLQDVALRISRIVSPSVTGDMTDSTLFLGGSGPRVEEWEGYARATWQHPRFHGRG